MDDRPNRAEPAMRAASATMLRWCGAPALALLCAASAAVFAPRPARAQAWIGEYVGRLIAQEAQHRCMMGEPLAEAEVAEALVPAKAAMAAYWRAAHASDGAAAGALFHASRHARWLDGEVAIPVVPGTLIDDPQARAAAAIDVAPEGFVRAGQGGTARGLWQLRTASGASAGAYLADFSRRAGVWKLRTLRVLPPGGEVPAIAPYCLVPGDVGPYRARVAAAEQARIEKRAAKAQARRSGMAEAR